ncbi:MAG: hypothetical protein IKV76_03730 [Clostridia bacterium]|nr:hypothetical protein [Clostridia bacterium]
MELSARYSNLIDDKLKITLALRDGVIFNNRYEGDAKAGSVKVRKSGAATVQAYDKVNGVTPTTGASEYITIDINKDDAVNEIFDKYDAAAVTDDMVADRLDAAGYAMALAIDTDGAAVLVAEGTAMADTAALTNKTVYGTIVDVRTTLSKIGVPATGRYLIVSPETYALILKSDEFIPASQLGDAVKQTGAVGAILGFNIYESANLGAGVEFVAGHPNYATRVNEWAVDVQPVDLTGSGKWIGACAVQGRKVYAHKVTKPECILVKKANA